MNPNAENTLARVRSDLETMDLAAGFGPRYGPEDAGAFTGYGMAGLLLALWNCWPHGGMAQAVGMLGFLAACAGVWAFQTWRNRLRRPHPPGRVREARLVVLFTVIFCVSLWGCLAWARWQGLPRGTAVGASFALGGLLCVPLGLTDRWRRLWLGFAAPNVLLGTLWPALPERWRDLAFGLAFAVGSLAAAGILRHQLKKLNMVSAASHAD